MAARTRTRPNQNATPGKQMLVNGSSESLFRTGSSDVIATAVCSDTTMPRPYTVDHNLLINTCTVQPLRINGVAKYNPSGSLLVRYDGYNPANLSQVSYVGSPSPFDSGYWKTKALANVNPYNPAVDVPLFLFEFKDFPGMLKDLGRVLKGSARASDVPGGYLAYSFGWAPLVDDVMSLFNLAASIDAAMRTLRNQEKGRTTKRTLYSGNTLHSVISGSESPSLVGFHVAWSGRRMLKRKVWYTANAKLIAPLPPSDLELRALSRRVALGLTLRPSSVWDFIPWTWLIDYFANIGDFLQAAEGMCRTRVTRMNVMCSEELSVVIDHLELAPGLSGGAYSGIRQIKQRVAFVNPTPVLRLTPFLTGGQLGILGALATAKALKGASRR